jgi:hypothetical protein
MNSASRLVDGYGAVKHAADGMNLGVAQEDLPTEGRNSLVAAQTRRSQWAVGTAPRAYFEGHER